jgi:hypothetical protein
LGAAIFVKASIKFQCMESNEFYAFATPPNIAGGPNEDEDENYGPTHDYPAFPDAPGRFGAPEAAIVVIGTSVTASACHDGCCCMNRKSGSDNCGEFENFTAAHRTELLYLCENPIRSIGSLGQMTQFHGEK